MKKRVNLKQLNTDGRIILKWLLNRMGLPCINLDKDRENLPACLNTGNETSSTETNRKFLD
jgi:hypothetical protein